MNDVVLNSVRVVRVFYRVKQKVPVFQVRGLVRVFAVGAIDGQYLETVELRFQDFT
jgi:hypothetical protein